MKTIQDLTTRAIRAIEAAQLDFDGFQSDPDAKDNDEYDQFDHDIACADFDRGEEALFHLWQMPTTVFLVDAAMTAIHSNTGVEWYNAYIALGDVKRQAILDT